MPILRVEVELPYTTGLPADVAVNTFHLSVPTGVSPTDVVSAVDAIGRAYAGGTTGANGYSWGNILSPIVDPAPNKCGIKVYDLADPKPRPPVYTSLFTRDAQIDNGGVPFEVAIAVSYHAAPVAGIDRRRLRGRIYLGPLNAAVLGTLTTDLDPIVTNVRVDLAEVAETVRSEIAAVGAGNLFWGVYSRAGSYIHEITGGFVDNEFDTQRRRGVPPTARSIWGS